MSSEKTRKNQNLTNFPVDIAILMKAVAAKKKMDVPEVYEVAARMYLVSIGELSEPVSEAADVTIENTPTA